MTWFKNIFDASSVQALNGQKVSFLTIHRDHVIKLHQTFNEICFNAFQNLFTNIKSALSWLKLQNLLLYDPGKRFLFVHSFIRAFLIAVIKSDLINNKSMSTSAVQDYCVTNKLSHAVRLLFVIF